MRKIFYGLGVVAAVLIVVAAGGFFFLTRAGNALDAEIKTHVDDAVVAISAHWDKAELMKRAAPELAEGLKPDELDTLFDVFASGLGPLVEYGGAEGRSVFRIRIGQGITAATANYLARAHYEKGDAEIRMSLVKREDRWLIEDFSVNSNALIGNPASGKS